MRHDTKWTVTNLRTGGVVAFDSEQQARTYCLLYGDTTPLSMRPPLYL